MSLNDQIRQRLCYARSLDSCSPTLSREHYISESVLRQLSDDGIRVDLRGLAWQPKDRQSNPPIAGLTGRILCEKHNQQLSPVDAAAKQFFRSLKTANEGAIWDRAAEAESEVHIDGNLFERWILKTLIGGTYSKNLPDSEGNPVTDFCPSALWVEILFGRRPFPLGWGIYCPSTLGSSLLQTRLEPTLFGFSILYGREVGLHGCILEIGHLFWLLVMAPPPVSKQGTFLEGAHHRPTTLILRRNATERKIHFDWGNEGENRTITVEIATR